MIPKRFFNLYLIHVFNDGFQASLLLFLPFIAKDLGFGLSQVGILSSGINMLGLIFALPAGFLAARFGGNKILLFLMLFYVFGFVGTAISSSFILLLLAFILAGVAFGSFHPLAFGLVALWAPKNVRGKILGDFTAAGDIGKAAITAIITALIVRYTWQSVAWAYAVVAVLVFVYMLLAIRFSGHAGTGEKKAAGQNFSASVKHYLKNPSFMLVTLSAFFDNLGSFAMLTFLPFLFLQKGIAPAALGLLVACFVGGNILGKSAFGRVVDRYGSTLVLFVGEALTALLMVGITLVSGWVLLAVVSFLLGISTKGTIPVTQSMFADILDAYGQDHKAYGLNSTLVSIAVVIAPVILGFVSESFGLVWAFYISAAFSLLAVLPILIIQKFKITSPTASSPQI